MALKSDCFMFLRKFVICKCVKWDIFGPKFNIFELFFKSDHYIFLKLYLMTGIKRSVDVMVLEFSGNFCDVQIGEGGYFWLKILTVLTFQVPLK